MTERLHCHFSLSCIGEGNGNPLQCSCLENPRDGGAWWAAVSGVAQSGTQLKQLSSSSSTLRSLRTTLKHPGVQRATSPETVRIGAMLAYTPLDEKSLALLLNYLHNFLKYLAKNSAILFSASDYEVAPPSTIGKPCEAHAPTHI